jgi:prepilin-type N-terminal cleavage/methylation domain-containing protein
MKHSAAGFSLVELMVAVTLGLLAVGAIVSVFVGSRSAVRLSIDLRCRAGG